MNTFLRIGFSTLFTLLSLSVIGQKTKPIFISGQVVESTSQNPVEFATVAILNVADNSILDGTTTDVEGKFLLKSSSQEIKLEISFIGFSDKIVEEYTVQNGRIDLGQIIIEEQGQILDELVVRAEKSTTEFKLDKRVFNVGKDLSSTGASALEVLNNVPSVNVNIEGEIQLRGSGGVQVLINGKPSVIASEEGNALGTITADMIDKVEVITNPSAKYDAEGTSGIINIVIKKEERRGINGSITLNTGVPHNHSIGLSLNRRTERFNLFSQLGVGYRELPFDRETINEDRITGRRLSSIGEEFRNETFYNFVLGTDYIISENQVLTLSGNVAYEIEDQPSETQFTLVDGAESASWIRNEITEATNPKFQYELQYKNDIDGDKDHNVLFSALGNFFGKDQSSVFTTDILSGTVDQPNQETRTNFMEAKYTFKLDYTRPLSEDWTLETGAQYVLQDVSNDFEVSDEENGVFIVDPSLSNIFEYNQNVLGVYGTIAYENEIWGIKAGLRVEDTDLKTFLVNTEEDNSQKFTNLFPSFHTSYKLTQRFSVQAGYSRRIFRPRLWNLNPFFNIRNNFSIRTGNPALLPEYTDSYEVSAIYILPKVTLNGSVYYRYTTDVVERVATFSEGVSFTSPVNLGTTDAVGIEFNAKYSPSKTITINGDFNYNYFQRLGEFEGTSFDFNADEWSTKWTSKFKLPAGVDFEVTGRYNSAVQTLQGTNADNLFADLGIRKKILKGRGVINFSIRDIFASRVRESETDQDDFYLYNWGQRGRFITMGFSYGFGKGEAMEFSGRRRR